MTVLERVTCYIAVSRAICRISGQSTSTTRRASQLGFLCPAWKIAIGLLATSALATSYILSVYNSLLLLLLLSLVFLYSSNLQALV